MGYPLDWVRHMVEQTFYKHAPDDCIVTVKRDQSGAVPGCDFLYIRSFWMNPITKVRYQDCRAIDISRPQAANGLQAIQIEAEVLAIRAKHYKREALKGTYGCI
jgi:hypothetical protein